MSLHGDAVPESQYSSLVVRPEDAARVEIDAALEAAGWPVQDRDQMNVEAGPGVAVREFPLRTGFGSADYMLYADGRAVGVIEAKKAGVTLTGVEVQAEKYSVGVPDHVPAIIRPLPFLYQSTGIETFFTNRLDPDPRSRRVFHFHRPATLSAWVKAEPTGFPDVGGKPDPRSQRPANLRTRLLTLPSLERANLWPAQQRAVQNLEVSLRENRLAASSRWPPARARLSPRSRPSTGS